VSPPPPLKIDLPNYTMPKPRLSGPAALLAGVPWWGWVVVRVLAVIGICCREPSKRP